MRIPSIRLLLACLQADSEKHNSPTEREPRLRAVSLREFFNGLGNRGANLQTSRFQNGEFCLIRIESAKHDFRLEAKFVSRQSLFL